MLVMIETTKEDVREGVARHCDRCPVARAVNRKLKPGFAARVSAATIEIHAEPIGGVVPSWRWTGEMPAVVGEFIRTFDNRTSPSRRSRLKPPCSFSMDIPAEYLA